MSRFFDEAASFKPEDAVSEGAIVSPMGCQHDGHAGGAKVLQNKLFAPFVHGRCRFIEKQKPAPTQNRPSDSQPLPFSA